MSRIALLPEEVASQVAAGEVVERPASVVKELVENSLDAGATRIEVLIRRGGNSFIRVVDNGCGMDRDDALLCLERHATSKIRTGADLMAIHTLGFRGEALPSIASVSRFRLTTRERGALAGTEVIVSGGKMEAVRDCGEPEGTQIEARSLFYNLPARRKFLRSENTEASHVEHVLQLQAIGHPHVGFTLLNDDRLVHQLPPGQTLRERRRQLREIVNDWARLDALIDDRLGNEAPSLARVGEVLRQLGHALTSLLGGQGEHLPEDDDAPVEEVSAPEAMQDVFEQSEHQDAAAAPMTSASASAPGNAQAPTGQTVMNRESAYRQLEQIAEFLQRTEPHSPIPYLVRRAITWGRMPLPQLMQEMLKQEGDVQRLFGLLGVPMDSE